jgi:hypothetical protein
MTPEEQDLIRKRQRSRSILTALLLGGLVLLFFGITIAKLAGPGA